MAEEYLVNSGLAYTIIHPGARPLGGALHVVDRYAVALGAMALRRVACVPLLVVCMSGRNDSSETPSEPSFMLSAQQAPRAPTTPH